jgi:hypothetical protein
MRVYVDRLKAIGQHGISSHNWSSLGQHRFGSTDEGLASRD